MSQGEIHFLNIKGDKLDWKTHFAEMRVLAAGLDRVTAEVPSNRQCGTQRKWQGDQERAEMTRFRRNKNQPTDLND